MKRIMLAVTILIAVFALAPMCQAAENPAPSAIPGGADAAAVVHTALPAQAGGCAAMSQAQPDLKSQLDSIFSPATETPCSKCFSLGLDCCTNSGGVTVCC